MRSLAPALIGLASLLSACASSTELRDAASFDGAIPAVRDVDPTGRWLDCGRTLTFTREGTASRTEVARACTETGTYRVNGSVVTLAWRGDGCDRSAREESWNVLVDARGIVLVSSAGTSVERYAVDGTPAVRWSFVGRTADGRERRSVVRTVGTFGVGFASACYWSEDGACSGLFSCAGRISEWRTAGDAVSLGASCTGMCPCGSVANLTRSGDSLSGPYRSVNCEGTEEGTLVATIVPE